MRAVCSAVRTFILLRPLCQMRDNSCHTIFRLINFYSTKSTQWSTERRSGSFSREFNLRLKTKYILHERLVWLSVCNMALSVAFKNDSCKLFSQLQLCRLFPFYSSSSTSIWQRSRASNIVNTKRNQVKVDSIGHEKTQAAAGFRKIKNAICFMEYIIAAWHRLRGDTNERLRECSSGLCASMVHVAEVNKIQSHNYCCSRIQNERITNK